MNRLSEFGRFILDRTEWIGARWNKVNGSHPELPLSGNTSRRQFADYLPALCANLTRRFEKEARTHRADRKRQKDALPQHRWQPGYNVEEIVRELGHIRRVISVDCFDAFARNGAELDPSARATAEALIHEFFDELIVETVQQFASERERLSSPANKTASPSSIPRSIASSSSATTAVSGNGTLLPSVFLVTGASAQSARNWST